MHTDMRTGSDGWQVNGAEMDRLRGKMEKESEAWLDAEREWMKKREQNKRGIW